MALEVCESSSDSDFSRAESHDGALGSDAAIEVALSCSGALSSQDSCTSQTLYKSPHETLLYSLRSCLDSTQPRRSSVIDASSALTPAMSRAMRIVAHPDAFYNGSASLVLRVA